LRCFIKTKLWAETRGNIVGFYTSCCRWGESITVAVTPTSMLYVTVVGCINRHDAVPLPRQLVALRTVQRVECH